MAILNPDVRWFPSDEILRESSYEKLLPLLIHELRKKVKAWREAGYVGANQPYRHARTLTSQDLVYFGSLLGLLSF